MALWGFRTRLTVGEDGEVSEAQGVVRERPDKKSEVPQCTERGARKSCRAVAISRFRHTVENVRYRSLKS